MGKGKGIITRDLLLSIKMYIALCVYYNGILRGVLELLNGLKGDKGVKMEHTFFDITENEWQIALR